MPLIGLGTSMIKDSDNFTDFIRAALDNGYRHFDTAIFYYNH